LSATGALHSLVRHAADFKANTCYQVDFCYRGSAGTEDLQLLVGNTALTETYAFNTDTWTGAQTSLSLTDIGTTWTCESAFIRTGAVAKTSYVLAFAMETADGDYAYVDFVQMQELNVCDVTGSLGNVLTNPATSDPQWGHSEKLLPRVGTGPAGDWGMGLDGTNDYLSCADADCEMDPVNWEGGGSFSVGCRAMTDTVSGVDYIISKAEVAGGQKSWLLLRNSAGLAFYVSDDGTNSDSNSVTMFVADTLQGFVSTFDPSGGSGACENKLYYDAYQVDTDGTMTECVPFDSTASFHIGAYGSTSYNWIGSILECSLWETELSAIESNKYINPYFPATRHGDGLYVDSCSQAASHAVCSSQVCRDGAPNTCQAEGTGVMACYQGYSSFPENNSFEMYTGTDDSPDFTDWQEISATGLSAYHADKVHGDTAMRMKISTAQYARVATGCLATTKQDTTFALKVKGLSDTVPLSTAGGFQIIISQYSTGACGGWVEDLYYDYDPLEGGWENFITTMETTDWHASAASYCFSISISNVTNADVLVDAVQITESSYKVPWVHVPAGGGAVSYTSRPYKLHNPLSDYVESEGKYGYEDGFCVAAWLYSDWAADGNDHVVMASPATAGNNNKWRIEKASNNNMLFWLWDAAGNSRYVYLAATGTTWTEGGWKYIEVCSNNTDNVVVGHWYNVDNATWYTMGSLGGAGTGIQDGQSTTMYVGNRGTDYLDGFISEIHISPYSVIWPQKGFNSGKPPVNGNPY
jgi:hypothetical protein